MKTNFFETIAGIGVTGDLKITVSFGATGNLVVSVILANENLADKAGKLIQPMILRGNAVELDEGFFDNITTPLQETTALFTNMDAYQQGLDKARLASKQEQDKKNKNTKVKAVTGADEEDAENEGESLFNKKEAEKQQAEEKKKAYDEAMKLIGELNGQMKYEEALAILPLVADYPDKALEINKRSMELNKRKDALAALKLDL